MQYGTENGRLKTIIQQSTQWMTPGLGVKRWLIILFLGITLTAIGAALFILDIYRSTPDTWWLPLLSWLSLRFLPRLVRVIVFGGIGLGILGWGIWGLNRALMAPFMHPGQPMVDALARHRRRKRGPKIVVLGGGTGLSVLLRGLKVYTHNLAAVVTVADDGGSSGRLRRTLGILPPGDIRNCLAALSDDEQLITQLFRYRFAKGNSGDLDGHSFGNLFISAMTGITGSFEEAIAESGRVLAVHGRVLPSTLHDVQLTADIVLPHVASEVRVAGESQIPEVSGNIRRVWLEPNNPPAFPEAIQTILNADLIVMGPGSLYTSILPNLLVPDIANAVRISRALKIYVCNVATQPGETDNYTCGDHLRVLEDHLGGNVFDIILWNNNMAGKLPEGLQWVISEDDLKAENQTYGADVVDKDHPWRHDAEKLAKVLWDLLLERTGPLII